MQAAENKAREILEYAAANNISIFSSARIYGPVPNLTDNECHNISINFPMSFNKIRSVFPKTIEDFSAARMAKAAQSLSNFGASVAEFVKALAVVSCAGHKIQWALKERALKFRLLTISRNLTKALAYQLPPTTIAAHLKDCFGWAGGLK